MSDAIRRHLETMLNEGNPPTRQNDNPQRRVLVFEMSIPGGDHEDIGHGQQENRLQEPPLRFNKKFRAYCFFFCTCLVRFAFTQR